MSNLNECQIYKSEAEQIAVNTRPEFAYFSFSNKNDILLGRIGRNGEELVQILKMYFSGQKTEM